MMPLNSVDPQLGREPDYVGQLGNIGLKKCELKADPATVSSVGRDFVPNTNELSDVLENFFEFRPLHDGLRRLSSRTVPRDLDIARHRGDQSCPFRDGFTGESPVSRKIQLNVVLFAQR